MKRIILSLCVLAILLCCSCGMFGEQRYICDVAQVDSIQIVRLDKYIAGEYRYEYTILSEIADSYGIFRFNAEMTLKGWREKGELRLYQKKR